MIVRHIHMHIPCEAHIESMGHGEVLVLVRREDRGARARCAVSGERPSRNTAQMPLSVTAPATHSGQAAGRAAALSAPGAAKASASARRSKMATCDTGPGPVLSSKSPGQGQGGRLGVGVGSGPGSG